MNSKMRAIGSAQIPSKRTKLGCRSLLGRKVRREAYRKRLISCFQVSSKPTEKFRNFFTATVFPRKLAERMSEVKPGG
jgi:hypothetical protein